MVVGIDSNPNQPVIVDSNTGVGSTPFENADFGSTTSYNTNQATQGTNPYSNLMDSKVDGQSEIVTEMKTDGSKILARSQDEDELISDEGEGNRKGFWFKGRYYKAKPGQKGGPKPGGNTGGTPKPPTLGQGPISGGGGTVTIGGGTGGGLKTLPGVGTGGGLVAGGGTGRLGGGLNLGGGGVSVGVGGVGSGFGSGFVNPISSASSSFTNTAVSAQQRVLVQPGVAAASKSGSKAKKVFEERKIKDRTERERQEREREERERGGGSWDERTFTSGDWSDQGRFPAGDPNWSTTGGLGGRYDAGEWNFKPDSPDLHFQYDWSDVTLAQKTAMRRYWGPEAGVYYRRWVEEQHENANPNIERAIEQGYDRERDMESAERDFSTAVQNPDTGEFEAEGSAAVVDTLGPVVAATLLGATSIYLIMVARNAKRQGML